MLRSMLRVSPCSGNFCAALSLEDCTRNATACSHKAWNTSSKAALSKAALSKACLLSLHRCPYIKKTLILYDTPLYDGPLRLPFDVRFMGTNGHLQRKEPRQANTGHC